MVTLALCASFASSLIDVTELLAEPDPPRAAAETDTEQWLRTMDAYDAFTSVVLARLEEAERRGSAPHTH